eukprot:767137-Hanusia_phi.AAC.11
MLPDPLRGRGGREERAMSRHCAIARAHESRAQEAGETSEAAEGVKDGLPELQLQHHIRPGSHLGRGPKKHDLLLRERLGGRRGVEVPKPFGLVQEGAEQAIPDDEEAAEVLVHPAVVVDAVVGGSHEDPLQHPQPSDQAGVHPELIGDVGLVEPRVESRMEEESHGQVEHAPYQGGEPGLPESSGQVVVLRRVVYRMACPEDLYLVGKAVEPVVAEVREDKTKEPDPRLVHGELQETSCSTSP